MRIAKNVCIALKNISSPPPKKKNCAHFAAYTIIVGDLFTVGDRNYSTTRYRYSDHTHRTAACTYINYDNIQYV